MNPFASQCSPSSVAMVQYGGAVKANGSEGRLHDLIIHESIKQLIRDMQELEARTACLEHENASLKLKNSQLELALKSMKHQMASGFCAPAVQGNLSGYAASDGSSNGMFTSWLCPRLCSGLTCRPDIPAASHDTTVLEKKVSEHQNTVTEILEKFNEKLSVEASKRKELAKQCHEHLSVETSKREELVKQVNESQYTLKGVQGRAGVLESNFKTIVKAYQNAHDARCEIDNAATRQALYELYHRYTTLIDDATGEKLDDLWELRDWVVVRLALFDLYGKALQEAKTADIGL